MTAVRIIGWAAAWIVGALLILLVAAPAASLVIGALGSAMGIF